LAKIGDHEKYDYFYSRIMELKERFRRVGFTGPPLLIITGKK
jgi:hypothetical protein